VAASGDFDKVARDIEQYKRRKSEKTVSLREDEFAKQWNEGKAADDEEKKLEEQTDPQRPIVKRDYYFEEAMNVVVDYLAAMAGGVDSLAKIVPAAAAPAEAPASAPAIQ
jgi:hypothetical protein